MPLIPNTRLVAVSRGVSKCCAAAVLLIGLAVLIGWALDVQGLKGPLPGTVSMKANTALCFVLIGVSLWLAQGDGRGAWRRRAGRACAAAVGAIGLLTLLEYLFGWDLLLDQALFKEAAGAVGTTHLGRMAPNTAVCFLSVGVALLLVDARIVAARWASGVLIHFAGLVGMMVLVGYAYGSVEFTGLAAYTKMALHTAAAFVLAYVGVLAARPDRGLAWMLTCDSVGGSMLRLLLPVTVLFMLLSGWLRIVGERQGLYSAAFGTAFFSIVRVLVLAAALTLAAWMLHRADIKRREAENEVRKLNDQLAQRAVLLEAANKELDAFCYSVSHDLRAPLRGMDGFSLALLEDYGDKLDETGQDYLRRVRAASQRMAQLIDDMLMLSRVTRREMSREQVDLSKLAEAVAADLRSSVPARNVELHVAPGLVADGDPALLRVVLENLLGNAWKFTGKRQAARIEFGAAQRDGVTAFFVRDNGAGFDMAYADKLFVPFQRLHSTAEFPGTGVGIASVQRIIQRHGGRVWAEAEVGKGATFYFTL